MRVHVDTAQTPCRRLTKKFDTSGTIGGDLTKAIGITAPTKLSHAMGQAGKDGIVTFIASDGGTQLFTLYEWNAAMAQIASGNGWVLSGNTSLSSSQTCDAGAKITFKASEDAIFFIKAAAVVTDCIVSGTEAGANPNTDLSSGITH